MNKYAKYIKELKNYEMYEDEKGFVTYGPYEEGIYIEEIYVEPEYRKSQVAVFYADLITEIARREKITKLYGSVVPSQKNSQYRIEIFMKYGFRIYRTQEDLIVLIKEII